MRSKGRTCRRSLPGALAVLLCLGAAPANAAEHASASSTTRFLASFSGPTRKASKSFSSPVELLIRYQRIGWLDKIDDELFPKWEQWFMDVEESHTSLPKCFSRAV